MTTTLSARSGAGPEGARRDLSQDSSRGPARIVRALGGPRYTAALAVDALGGGLLRPFLLLYGIAVLHLGATVAGTALTAAITAGLAAVPLAGRWLDRGARSTVVAASMLVRVAGTVLLITAPAGRPWPFVAAVLFIGIGNQTWPPAHAALVATLSTGRDRDAALAAGRSLRNAGMGLGALLAALALTGGPEAMRALAAASGLAYLAAGLLAASVRLHAPRRVPGDPVRAGAAGTGTAAGIAAPRLGGVLIANVAYVFCLAVPEIALPLLLTRMGASPIWAAGVFVANTVMVVALQVPVTALMSRFPHRTTLAAAGAVLTASYLGFLAAAPLGPAWAAPTLATVSTLCTLGEILYTAAATPLVAELAPPEGLGRALARLQLSSGFGLAVAPAVITGLAAAGPAVLWGVLAATTLTAAGAVRR